MTIIGRTLSLRIECTANHLAWNASIEELGIAAVGYTVDDAIFTLGQSLCALAESAQREHKDMFDLITKLGE